MSKRSICMGCGTGKQCSRWLVTKSSTNKLGRWRRRRHRELGDLHRMMWRPQKLAHDRVHVLVNRIDDAAVNEPPGNLVAAQTPRRLSYVPVQNSGGGIIEWVGHRVLGMQPFQPMIF